MKIIECVPNFSEGRDTLIIDKIIEPIKSNDKVELLDVDPGFDTNRTVVTFIGTPGDVIEVAFKCIKLASKLIDMSKHSGEHPRMGATDVCPLVPVKDVSMKECIELSKKLGEKVGKELNIPIFLYENSATQKDRINLASIRKGEYEGMNDKLQDSYWKPDFGPNKLNLKAGVTAIGAREFLIAYNVNLNTFDKKIATDIALDIREAGRAKRDSNGKIIRDKNNKIIKKPGKLKYCKAVGWYIDEYRQAQVSINLTNFKKTSLHRTFEEVRLQARKRGVRVTGSEIVGLVPKQAMINSGKYYLKKQKRSSGLPEVDIIEIAKKSLGLEDIGTFVIKEKIIDFQINSTDKKLIENTLSDFNDQISRDTPTPGGGSASAYMGSVGASLSAMVANLSVTKKGLEHNYNRFLSISENCQKINARFLELVDLDSQAYDSVIAAIRLPKKSKIDIKNRDKAIEQSNVYAANIPLEILKECVSGLKQTLAISEIGNPNSITDVGVAVESLKASAKGAALNIIINAKSLSKSKEKSFLDKIDYYMNEVNDYAIKIEKNVNNKLND